jgi:Mor family transcriptional regulator
MHETRNRIPARQAGARSSHRAPPMPDQSPAAAQEPSNLVWPQRLAEAFDVLVDVFVRKGEVDKPRAVHLAGLAVAELAHHFGGRPFYLPCGHAMRRAVRDAQIWAEFNGSNHVELCDRHGLTISQVYKIVAKQRELLRQRRERKSTPVLLSSPEA